MRLYLKREFSRLKDNVCNKKSSSVVLLISTLKRTNMKTEIHTLEKSDLNSKRNHVLALYIVTITCIVATYSLVAAVQYL